VPIMLAITTAAAVRHPIVRLSRLLDSRFMWGRDRGSLYMPLPPTLPLADRRRSAGEHR
jgi:hypothetical protein